MTQYSEESDAGMVPKKSAKTWVTPVESMEGRAAAKGKSASRNALRAQDRQGAPTQVERIGQRAKEKKGERFDNLLSAIQVPLLKEAYQQWCGGKRPGWVIEGRRKPGLSLHATKLSPVATAAKAQCARRGLFGR